MKKKICVVLADYYPDVSEMLVKGLFRELKTAKNKNIIKIADNPILVPGVFEIPVTISKLIKEVHSEWDIDKFNHVSGVFEIPVIISKLINKYDAFVALGCVIKGETPHFDLISKAVVNAIMDLSIKNKKPIGNGIITCLNMKQALERADPKKKNIGGEAVSAVLQSLMYFR